MHAKNRGQYLFDCLLILVVMALYQSALPRSKSVQVEWIQMRNQRLVYGSDKYGNRIPDFSTAGYGGGGVEIPTVPTKVTLQPKATGDDTPRTQSALDALAHEPIQPDGFRGALALEPGVYRISGTVMINASGVVLRGSGIDEHGTILVAQGSPHVLVRDRKSVV